jgi:spore germination protein YaaH
LYLIFLLNALTISWAGNSANVLLQMKNSRSIHEVEWRSHQDFIPGENTPLFQGRPEDLVEREVPPGREVFGYLPYWVYSNYPNLNYGQLTTIAYFGADVNESGNITNLHNWPAAGLINMAHSQGVRVVLTVILFDRTQLGTLLNSPSNRTNLVNNLLTQVQNANADGVTIDFETVPSSARQGLTDFMTELTTTFHNSLPGSYVSIFTPAVDWSNAFDYYNLSRITDALIMQGYDFHWSTAPNAGPVAPLTGGPIWGQYCVSWTVNDYLNKTLQNTAKLILSVPFYGFEWNTADGDLNSPTLSDGSAIFYSTAYANALYHGRLWEPESQTPWYKYNSNALWYQGWYDDSLSLALKFNLINQDNLKGVAIWALTYDGQRQELQAALANAFGSGSPPLRPVNFRLANRGNYSVEATVSPAAAATGYRLYQSTNGVNFTAGTDFPNAEIILNSLFPDSLYYFKISAFNGNGESLPSEVLAVKPSSTPADILIVNGFDRVAGTVNNFDYINRFAPSVNKAGRVFDSCSNECIIDDIISLRNYDVVVWISGEEGTTDQSFSPAEQQKVSHFLENGGSFFVSGSEIGYDLVEQGNSEDQAFYRDYLKAEYVADRVPTHTVSGIVSSIFEDLVNLTFDNGLQGTYDVDYPDGFRPAAGSVQCLTYDGFDPAVYGGAGIQYQGIFGGSAIPGKLVYLGVPFETFYPSASRDSLMIRVLRFFGHPTKIVNPMNNGSPSQFQLSQNFPNPFNPATTIAFTIPDGGMVQVRLEIFDVLGREIITLLNEKKSPGRYSITWDGISERHEPVPSGVYIYRLTAGKQSLSRKMYLLR